MSYILDALKKAEQERGLSKVPTLTTVHAPRLWILGRKRWRAALGVIASVCAVSIGVLVVPKLLPVRTAPSAPPQPGATAPLPIAAPAPRPPHPHRRSRRLLRSRPCLRRRRQAGRGKRLHAPRPRWLPGPSLRNGRRFLPLCRNRPCGPPLRSNRPLQRRTLRRPRPSSPWRHLLHVRCQPRPLHRRHRRRLRFKRAWRS